MSGTIPLVPVYVFVVWTATTFSLLPFIQVHVHACATHTLWTALNKFCRQADILPLHRHYFVQSCVFPRKVVMLLMANM